MTAELDRLTKSDLNTRLADPYSPSALRRIKKPTLVAMLSAQLSVTSLPATTPSRATASGPTTSPTAAREISEGSL